MSEAIGGSQFEAREEALDPHRRQERDAVTAEIAGRLANRGVRLTGNESSEQIVEILESVERFERTVEAHGGDLMVDTGSAAEPDDPLFVLPKRTAGESVSEYLSRIDAAARAIRASKTTE